MNEKFNLGTCVKTAFLTAVLGIGAGLYLLSKPQPKGEAKAVETEVLPARSVLENSKEKDRQAEIKEKNYLENIVQRPVKNQNPISSRRYEYIVVHTTGSDNIEGTLSWFDNPNSSASAHYVIDRDGTIIQTVQDNQVAWHVKPVYNPKTKKIDTYNARSIGIELVGMPNRTTKEQEDAAAQLIKDECNKYGIRKENIVGHMELDPVRKPLEPGRETLKAIRGIIPDDVGMHTNKPKDNHQYYPYLK